MKTNLTARNNMGWYWRKRIRESRVLQFLQSLQSAKLLDSVAWCIKGTLTCFELIIAKFVFFPPFLMWRMINIGIFNASTKLESNRFRVQNSLYCKQAWVLCCIGISFNGVVLSFIDNFINTLHQFILISTNHFVKEMKIT